jgi:LPS-assembly protein
MQIKNKIIILTLILFLQNHNLLAEEFNISASEISFDKENNILFGKGSVEVSDDEGKIIKSDKVTYTKDKEYLLLEGTVSFLDLEGNIIRTDKATYDKINDIIITFNNTFLELKNGYLLTTNKIFYYNKEKVISSNQKSTFTDKDKNEINVTNFQYDVNKNLFSSVGDIKVIDANKNEYVFKEIYVDTLKRNMIGSDVSVTLDQENFGTTQENDPRFVANDILITKDKSELSKAVFTVCKKRDDKCPPWSIKAKKISHDKIKKTIYYDHATLMVYDVPIFYFPKFFHPDPSVKRQSGFLSPLFSNSNTLGAGFALPYYWAINNDKDLTFTPKIYNNENLLILNEYRQAYKNAFLTLDTSYTEGYKNTSLKKTGGSRNHIFADLDINLGKDKDYESNLSFKTQRTSNDTYFRVHDINTKLVDSADTDLINEINYNYSKDSMYLNITGSVYENLRDVTNSRYEYILPNILFGKSIFTENLGTLNFKSNAIYKNYKVNKHLSLLTNDVIWNPSSYISKKGFINSFEAMLRNKNYESKNTTDYKTEGTINELSSVLSFKSSLPMKKNKINSSNIFSPNFMIRYAPGHMRDLSKDEINLKYTNLFTTNKTSEIEDGISAVLGFDFKINKKKGENEEVEKLSFSLGQVFSPQENKDIPSKSSLDQKMSDVVGEFNYNFSNIGNIKYKFAVDHNLNDLNYNEVFTTLNFGKVNFNIDYLEEQNHIGDEHYVKTGFGLNINSNSSLNFNTKKNFKTESTELYDISYQYTVDCLTAGLVYRREFYEDSDVEQKDTLMFTIKFIPFTGISTPSLVNP